MYRIDLKGIKFGKLLVVEYIETIRNKGARWRCMCDCGKEAVVYSYSLRSSHTKSCGCYSVEAPTKRIKSGEYRNHKTSVEANIRFNMIDRCINPKNKRYSDWGGRGIKVCDRWMNSVEAFIEDMGRRPSKQHTLDRIDNDGDYEPTNCRWGTDEQQRRNKRNNHWIEYNGEKMIMEDFAKKIGAPIKNMNRMLRRKTIDQIVQFYKTKKQ